MSEVKFKKGYVVHGNNKPVNTLSQALAEQSLCDNCGCDSNLGFITLPDLNTADTRFLVYVYAGAVIAVADTAANRAYFEECCRERAAGDPGTSCGQLAP